MVPPAGLELGRDADGQVLYLRGEWRLAQLAALERASTGLRLEPGVPLRIDGRALSGLDSSGALLLLRRVAA